MSDKQRALLLVDKYLGDVATDGERGELELALRTDPDVADAFVRAARTDAQLDLLFTDSRQSQQVEQLLRAAIPPPRQAWFPSRYLPWAAAAVLLVAVGIALYFLPSSGEAVPYTVVSGRVLVDGTESRQVRAGARVEVIGDEAAVIRLAADGSLAELAPSSKGILRGRTAKDGMVFELTQGSCEFHLENAEGHWRVDTPVGKVSGRGAEFAVELRPGDREEELDMERQLAMTLFVAVMAGTVDVQFGSDSYTLGLGDNRVYAADKPAEPNRKPDVTAKVIAVADDGKSFTIETPPPAKREPPGKRTIKLTDQTNLSYANVPPKGEKPTVGYQARVWLVEGSAEVATAVSFSGQKLGGPEPDLAGIVLAVADSGKEFTLQLPSKKKGEPAPTVVIKIDDKAKLSYALVPVGGEKPTVGYNASVWLVKDSKDTASAVTFSAKKASVTNPDWMGRVTAVSADGKELTLLLHPKRKGEPGQTATLKIQDKTKLAYTNIDKEAQKPTVGFDVEVWLDKGSTDTAAGIRFSVPGKKGNPDGQSPLKGGEKAPALFVQPKGLGLTAEQEAQVAALLKDFEPRYQILLRKKEKVLTEEQKTARKIAERAVKEAGISDKARIEQMLAAATGITAEQQALMEALTGEEKELRQTFSDKLNALLTPEQKAKLPKPDPEGRIKTKP
jgi:hypothetical protein